MSDILQGLIGGGQAFVFAWVLPSAMTVVTARFVVIPSLTRFSFARELLTLDATQTVLVLGFAAVTIGLVLNAISTHMYRVLEGYAWPRKWRDWGIARQVKRRNAAQARVEAAPPNTLELALAFEKLRQFPDVETDKELAPTRLGNATRAFEAYGSNRYGLNSQLLWSELYALAPDALQGEHEQARAGVDFFVNAMWQAAMLAVAALAVGVGTQHFWVLIVFAVGVGLEPLLYGAAISGTAYWRSTVQAIVDIGRRPLAERLSFVMPATLEEEREMWREVARFVFYMYPYKDNPAKLARYRDHRMAAQQDIGGELHGEAEGGIAQ